MSAKPAAIRVLSRDIAWENMVAAVEACAGPGVGRCRGCPDEMRCVGLWDRSLNHMFDLSVEWRAKRKGQPRLTQETRKAGCGERNRRNRQVASQHACSEAPKRLGVLIVKHPRGSRRETSCASRREALGSQP